MGSRGPNLNLSGPGSLRPGDASADYLPARDAGGSMRSTTAVIFFMGETNSSRCVSRAPLVARALSAPLANSGLMTDLAVMAR